VGKIEVSGCLNKHVTKHQCTWAGTRVFEAFCVFCFPATSDSGTYPISLTRSRYRGLRAIVLVILEQPSVVIILI
jgi:hypothetical protein